MYEIIVSYFSIARSFEYTYLCVYVYDADWRDISSEVDNTSNILFLTKVVVNNEQPSIAMSVAIRDDFTWVVQVQGMRHVFLHSLYLHIMSIILYY